MPGSTHRRRRHIRTARRLLRRALLPPEGAKPSSSCRPPCLRTRPWTSIICSAMACSSARRQRTRRCEPTTSATPSCMAAASSRWGRQASALAAGIMVQNESFMASLAASLNISHFSKRVQYPHSYVLHIHGKRCASRRIPHNSHFLAPQPLPRLVSHATTHTHRSGRVVPHPVQRLPHYTHIRLSRATAHTRPAQTATGWARDDHHATNENISRLNMHQAAAAPARRSPLLSLTHPTRSGSSAGVHCRSDDAGYRYLSVPTHRVVPFG